MTMREFIEGLQIIARHEDVDSFCLRAEHDQFWASSLELPLTEEEVHRLEDLGWFKCEVGEGWSAFV